MTPRIEIFGATPQQTAALETLAAALGVGFTYVAHKASEREIKAAESGKCSGPLPGNNVTVVQETRKTKFVDGIPEAAPEASASGEPHPAAPAECACRKALEVWESHAEAVFVVAVLLYCTWCIGRIFQCLVLGGQQ